MFVWVINSDIVENGEGEAASCGVYLSEKSALEAFDRYKQSEIQPLLVEHGWFVFEESDYELDVGDTGNYLYNHGRLLLQKLEVEE